jgi:hypothetical protein
MPLPTVLRPHCPNVSKNFLIYAPFVVVAWWLVRATKPWKTKVFDAALARRDIPLSHYIDAGVWFGVLATLVLGLMLVASMRWWGSRKTNPVRKGMPSHFGVVGSAFWIGLVITLMVATWQRWPAMGHSFWGDEGWAFCDFVHGKWKPVEADGSHQDEIRFEKVKWRQTIFGDRSANNHWLGSILQRLCLDTWQQLTGRQLWDFDERVVRTVPLLAGLGSLVALALLGRRLGGPLFGLTAAAFMALHPLHIRFSVEARGYSLMLFFFTLAILALFRALELGRRRDWFWFGILQFLTLYSWKGAIYPLGALNVVTGGWLLLTHLPHSSHRATAVSRLMAANLFGAMLFLPLTMPSSLQVAKTIDEVRGRAKPMDVQWTRDAACETLLGMPWHQQDWDNPHEVTFARLRRDSNWPAVAGCVFLVMMGIGWFRFFRHDPLFSLVVAAIMLSGIVAALHFKHVLQVELLTWYLLFNVPLICLLLARAVIQPASRSGRALRVRNRQSLLLTAAVIAGFAMLTQPKARFFQRSPREDYRRAWELTRGAHEPRGYHGKSNIYTVWLWRHTHAYDPRGATYVRTRDALDSVIRRVQAESGRLYLIVGSRQLSKLLSGSVYAAARDPEIFEHVETLWGVEHLNTLEVYVMKQL